MSRIPRYGLKQLLITFTSLCSGLALITAATRRGRIPYEFIEIAAIVGVVLLGLGIGRLVGNTKKGLIAVILLALASYITSARHWEGGYPFGKIVLVLRDENHDPIAGANLAVYELPLRTLAFGRPLKEHSKTSRPISDRGGRIECRQLTGPFQFGGVRFVLFWIFPIGGWGPSYICEITHSDFETVRLSLRRLFEAPSRYQYEGSELIHIELADEDIPLPVYETDVVMKKKNR
jgi:hypothetical protein